MKVQRKTVIAVTLLCSLVIAAPCFAHKVRIFAWNEGDIIHTESKFSGGKAAQNATVTVVENTTGTVLLQGSTDREGLFEFPLPDTDSQELDIIVDSGDGHKNHWRYKLKPSSEKRADSPKQDPATSPIVSETATADGLTKQQLTTLLNDVLEAKLAPIRRQLAEQEEQTPSLQDIIGGIGYILGLAGIAAYIKSKK